MCGRLPWRKRENVFKRIRSANDKKMTLREEYRERGSWCERERVSSVLQKDGREKRNGKRENKSEEEEEEGGQGEGRRAYWDM